MDILNDVAAEWQAHAVAVGVSAVVAGDDKKLTRGIRIRAAIGNSANVYVGHSNQVTANTSAGTDGFQLDAGDQLMIHIDQASKVWLIGDAAAQKVFVTKV